MKGLLGVLLLGLPLLLKCQGFELSFGTDEKDIGYKVIDIPNEDASLVIYSISLANAIGFTKIDAFGNILWEKFENAHTISFNSTSDFVLENDGFRIGYVRSTGGFSAMRMIKYDFDGNLILEAGYALPLYHELRKVRFLSDNSLVGIVQQFFGDDATKLYKISESGDLLWVKTFPSSQLYSYICLDFQVMPNQEILAITLDQYTNQETIVTKFDPTGTILWQTTLPYETGGFNTYIMPFPDGESYFVWGDNYTNLFGGINIARLSKDGEILWSQDFSSHVKNIDNKGIIQGDGNTLYITGAIDDTSSNESEFVLLNLADDGNIIWEKKYSEFNSNYAGQVIRDTDGGLIVSASTNNWIQPGLEIYVFKTDIHGELIWKWYSPKPGSYYSQDVALSSSGGCLVLGNGDENYGSNYDLILTKINSNGSVYSNLINGHLVFDETQNCNFEQDEQLLANWKLKAVGTQTTYATTFPDGSFWLPTNSDSVQVFVLTPNSCWIYCAEPYIFEFPSSPDTIEATLFAQGIKDCPILDVDVSTSLLRRCFPNSYVILCKNTGTIPAENTKIKVYLDPYFEYIDASATLASQNGTEYIFDIGTLSIGETYTLTLQVKVSCNAELGQEHCLSVIAVADNACLDINNSVSQTRECQPNVGSFDPNDKRAFTQGTLTDRFIAADSIIEYQIRFQNTGTDTAFTVVITDTLSSRLDIESIHAGASSHAYHLELERNNILKFVFKDIMLPDSNINEPASHGFVKFRIRHKPGLVPGNVIQNKAAIFFDFNEAVITNNLELEIKSPPTATKPPRQVHAALLKVYPQPAADVVVFELKSTVGQQPCRLEILNLLGQRLYDQSIKKGANTISHLPAGQHFYRLWRNGEMVEVGKVLVIGN